MFRKKILVLISVSILFLTGCASNHPPKNTILFIGDGMGFEQVKAASIYLNGKENSLSFESFPYTGQASTHPASREVTDSAAAGTAMATGVKVNNGVISMRIPGNSEKLPTALEYFKGMGKKVGLVSTTHITHATPASFGSHNKSRNNYKEIAKDYLNISKPHVLLGGGKYVKRKDAEKAGYTVVTNRDELLKHNTKSNAPLSGQFGKENMPYEADGMGNLPHLSDMTKTAIKVLENSDKGFFLMVEGGRIDHSGHANNLKQNIFETIEFAKAVQVAIDWAAKRNDTLIVVTADHETGGLKVTKNNGKGKLPDVTWSSGGHTGMDVPLYAVGKNAKLFKGKIDNTDIFRLITQTEDAPVIPPQKKSSEKDTSTEFKY